MMKWKKISECHQNTGGKENTGHIITEDRTKGGMRIRPGIFAASAAICLVVSSLTAGCGFGKKAAETSPAAADERTEQTQTAQQTQTPQETEESRDEGIKYPDNCILYFKDDSGLARLKADMEAGEIPVDCKVLYDESGTRPVVTVTDPEKIREIYDRLTQVTVGEKSSRSITDSYHHVTFHLRNDSFVAVRFEGENLLCWGQENYEAQGASSLWTYIRGLQDEVMEKTAKDESSDSGQGSSSGKKSTDNASETQKEKDAAKDQKKDQNKNDNDSKQSSSGQSDSRDNSGKNEDVWNQDSQYEKEPEKKDASSSGKAGAGGSGIEIIGYSDDDDGVQTSNIEKEEDPEENKVKVSGQSGIRTETPPVSADTENQQPQETTAAEAQQPQETTAAEAQQSQETTAAEAQQSQETTAAEAQQSQETTATQDPQPQEISAKEKALAEQAYSEIVRAYAVILGQDADKFIKDYESGKVGANENNAPGTTGKADKNLNYRLLYEHFRNPEYDKVFYGFKDYNGDGIQELVLALGDNEYSRVWTAYTFDGKNAVELFRDHFSLDYRITLSVLEDKSFLIRASGGASAGRVTICRINKSRNGLEMIVEYEYDEQKNGNTDYISTKAAENAQSSEGSTGEGNEQMPQRMTQDEYNKRIAGRASSAEEGISFKILAADVKSSESADDKKSDEKNNPESGQESESEDGEETDAGSGGTAEGLETADSDDEDSGEEEETDTDGEDSGEEEEADPDDEESE